MAPRKNGNGKNTQLEAMEMVISASPIEISINWSEAVALSGALSTAHLQEILCQKLNTREPKIWESVPSEHRELLVAIKAELEDAPRQLQASVKPPIEIPLIEEPQAIIKSDELPKPTKGRGRPKKTDQLKESQELVVKEVKAIQIATTQRKSKAKSNAEEGKRTRQVKGRLRAVAEIAIEQSAYEEVLEAFENKRSEEIDTEFAEFLEDINTSLKASGAKVRVLTDEQIEELKAESVAADEAQEDFLSTTANLWG